MTAPNKAVQSLFLFSVRLTWANVQKLSRRFLLWIWGWICCLRVLNPLNLCRLSFRLSTSFTLDPNDGSIVYEPSIWERITQAFCSGRV
jgi:hypothetical protein